MGLKRLGFGVVTFTVTVLVLGGVIVKLAEPYLPKPELTADGAEQADFIEVARGQKIPWRALDEDTFAEARRLERPVMAVLGAVWSRDGRVADREIFIDEDVATTMRRNFVCARVDIDEKPFWLNALLPLSRVGLDAGPGFQVAFFTPQGQLYDYRSLRRSVGMNPDDFRQEIQQARELYDSLDSPLPPGANLQRVDALMLNAGASPGIPDPTPMLEFLRGSIPVAGGFGSQETQLLRVSNWRYLLMAGQTEDFQRSFEPALDGSIVDWLRGGFFRRARNTPWQNVDFDKLTVINAEMMQLLAEAYCITGEKRYRELAGTTFDSFVSDMRVDGLIVTARIGSEDRRGRSPLYSFSYNEIQPVWGGTILDEKDSKWAAENLELDPGKNPQMVIRVPNNGVENLDRFLSVMTKLKEARKDRNLVNTRRANAVANGRAAAAMLNTARLLDDPVRLELALQVRERVELFRSEDDVTHFTDPGLADLPFFGDYLAYAEAALAEYLATGRPKSLENGVAVLSRAVSLFATSQPGVFTDIPQSQAPRIPNLIAVPEVMDHLSESNIARFIRLATAYGRLCETGNYAPAAKKFTRAASASADHFGSVAPQLRLQGGGLYAACAPLIDGGYFVCTGPASASTAALVARTFPFRMVAPATTVFRPDIYRRPPGIYYVTSGEVTGPVDVAEMELKLGKSLRIVR
jgi:uncharacterized protein YyaL (SSP411 family)